MVVLASPWQRLRARKAQLSELQAIHSEHHTKLYGRPSQKKPGVDKKANQGVWVCGGWGVWGCVWCVGVCGGVVKVRCV